MVRSRTSMYVPLSFACVYERQKEKCLHIRERQQQQHVSDNSQSVRYKYVNMYSINTRKNTNTPYIQNWIHLS